MQLDCRLSEACGMMAADGCVQKSYICMWGNITEDRNYYDFYISPLFFELFKKKFNVHEKKSNSVYGFYLCSKEIVKFFNELEFPIGSKTYSIKVPEIILKSKDIVIYAAFIRGFTDCDGHLSFLKRNERYGYFKRNFHYYPRIFLSSTSYNLIKDISYMLEYLGIKNSVIIDKSRKLNEHDRYRITLRGIENLEKWIKIVGFSNSVNFTKYKIWKRFGFCPVNVSVIERTKILKGVVSLYLYYGHVAQFG